MAISEQDILPTPMLFGKKTLPANNILIGSDPAQIRFFLQQLSPHLDQDPQQGDLSTWVEQVDQVMDNMVMGRRGRVLQVKSAHDIQISADIRGTVVGIWSAAPIIAGSVGATSIVRHAWAMLGKKENLPSDVLMSVAHRIAKEPIKDVRGAVWEAAWLLLTGEQDKSASWPQPWNQPLGWMPKGVEPEIRLHTLYKVLVGWVLWRSNDHAALEQLRLTWKQREDIKTYKLDPKRVEATLLHLSAWRERHSDPWVCAIAVAAVWSA